VASPAKGKRGGDEMFEIQVLEQGQWRDDLVSNDAEDNQFATREDAEEAMTVLIAEADPHDQDVEWRVEQSNELTAQEHLDHHNAYHVSGMMDRDCQFCIAVVSLADYKEYFVGGK
jgi:hypothetical protein